MKYLFLFLMFCTNSLFASAKTYLVSNDIEINKIMPTLIAGDIMKLKNGTWRNMDIIIKANGMKNLPIVLTAETPGKVTISDNFSITINGKYIWVKDLIFKDGIQNKKFIIAFHKNSSYSRLTNCFFDNYNNPQKSVSLKVWIAMAGKYNRVDHCSFINKKTAGTLLAVLVSNKPNYHLIDSNYFGYRPKLNHNGAEIIRIGLNPTKAVSSNTRVSDNYFETCNGEVEIISNKSSKNFYIHNVFRKCQGTLSLRQGNNCLVEQNFFIGDAASSSGGVRVTGQGHKISNNFFINLTGDNIYSAVTLLGGSSKYPQVNNVTIDSNVFYNNNRDITIGHKVESVDTLPAINCSITNNIFSYSKNNVEQIILHPINFTFLNNIYYKTTTSLKSGFKNIDPKSKPFNKYVSFKTAKSNELNKIAEMTGLPMDLNFNIPILDKGSVGAIF